MAVTTRCRFPGCKEPTAAESRNNARFSRMYCEEHRKGVKTKCSVCGKEYKSKTSDAIKFIKTGKPITCRSCFITALNKTPAMREQARQLGRITGPINIKIAHEKWSKTERGREFARKLGSEIGKHNLIRFVRSKDGKKHITELGKKYGPITGPINIVKYNKSEKGRLKSAEIGRKIGKYNLINWLKTEEGIAHLSRMGVEIGKEEREAWQQSEECKKFAKLLGMKYGGFSFNRKEFYESKLELIRFESLDKIISLEDIDSYSGVGIVFSKEVYNADGRFVSCLDVAQSKNGQAELLFSIRAWSWATDHIHLTEQDMKDMGLSNISTRLKYQRMVKETGNNSLVIKIIASGIENKETREAIEAQYAHDTRALFWSPAPGQQIANNQSPLQI